MGGQKRRLKKRAQIEFEKQNKKLAFDTKF